MNVFVQGRDSDRQLFPTLLVEWSLSDLHVLCRLFLSDSELQTLSLNFYFIFFKSRVFSAEQSKLKPIQATLPGFYGAMHSAGSVGWLVMVPSAIAARSSD